MSSDDSVKHILVVEDERHLAIGIKYNLEAEGYQVSVAGDGRTALDMLEHDRGIDLLILDLMLPGMSGYAVCQSLREDGNDLPVLMLSARTLSEDRARGFDVGADQYLQKPFDLGELLSRVRGLLRRRLHLPPPNPGGRLQFEFADVKVNFDTFEVTVRGEALKLTHMEMKLLRYFIENEGRMISREELLDQVWGQPGSLTTRTVDNFLVRLRKYFETDAASPRHFLSVRGAGYRFISKPDE